MALGQTPVKLYGNGTHRFPDAIETKQAQFFSANGIEGRVRANNSGVFLESPDPSAPNAASASHWSGLYDPGVKNRVCDDSASANKGVDCGSDADCGGTVGACAIESHCSSGASSPGLLCQVDSACTGGSCNAGTAVTNFPFTGRPVLESGGSRTFIAARRDMLLDSRISQTPGSTGVCIKQSGACLTDADCTTKYCNGGASKDGACTTDADCASGKCETTVCMNLLCTKAFPFAANCTSDAACVTPAGQTCWRGYNSVDLLQRADDCAVDTGSVSSPGGDGRLDVATGNGEGNCTQRQTAGAGTASSTEHQFRWRMVIDSPGIPTRASGIAKCVGGASNGSVCSLQSDCSGGFCQSRDPYEAFHLELVNENATLLRVNRDGQFSLLGPVIFGNSVNRCTHNPVIQCTTNADCPPWLGGTADVCRGQEITLTGGAYFDSTVPFSSNSSLRPLSTQLLRLANAAGNDILSYTDPQTLVDFGMEARMRCNAASGTCAANVSSVPLVFRGQGTSGSQKEWFVFANGSPPGSSLSGVRLAIRRPGASTTPGTNADGVAIEEDSTNSTTVLTTPNGYIKVRADNQPAAGLCDATHTGLLAYSTLTGVGNFCGCREVSAGVYAWRKMSDETVACP